jgi:hypothetical protein
MTSQSGAGAGMSRIADDRCRNREVIHLDSLSVEDIDQLLAALKAQNLDEVSDEFDSELDEA